MIVKKKINNNCAICIDSKGREIIAFGKGIGFHDVSCEVDLSTIYRTFYDIDEIYLQMINDLPNEMLDIAIQVVDFAGKIIDKQMSDNVVVTLADHINFAIKRYRENLHVDLPIIYDIANLFEKELSVGFEALKIIEEKVGIELPEHEAAYIALQIINAEIDIQSSQKSNEYEVIKEIAKIIENHFDITLNRRSFNYSRFYTHMCYLLKRGKENNLSRQDNSSIYSTLVKEYANVYKCCEKIKDYLAVNHHIELTESEMTFLMMHVTRLCVREDC